MKFTLSWLKEHLDTTAPLQEIVETLTRIGLEVERVDDPAAALSAYTVAAVISPSRIRTRTGCASAWSTPAPGSPSRWCAARRTRAPA
jgi:phenylalanyl-tRNA synthetase beta chain